MNFYLQQWKDSLKEQLPGWQVRMKAAGFNSVYYLIAASAFVPVVQSVHSGDWGALAVLGSAVGTNLLANMVQNLKDKTDVEVAQALQAEVEKTPEIKAELDALLEKLEALQQARQALPEENKRWFEETIQRELAELNSTVTYTATLVGDGAIAQGEGAKAVGKGGVLIGGHATGNTIVTGNGNVVNVTPDPEAEKRRKAREAYLTRLIRSCLTLPLAALGGEESAESDVTLDKVYIDLNTTETRKKEKGDREQEESTELLKWFRSEKANLVPALESASQHPRLALLGDPGAGKSTFVKKVLAWQASACLGKAKPLPGFGPGLLPVLVILRELAPHLAHLDVDQLPAKKREEQLVSAVWQQIKIDLGGECTDFLKGMQEALQSGQCLLVLDGLDEVPQDLRGRVRQAVDALLKRYDVQRIIVTCRVRSYVNDAVLPQFTSRTLAPFDEDQIKSFVQAWYNTQRDLGRFNESQAKDRTTDLARAATQPDLEELSGNPMLLTTMAIIHQKEVGLPKERVRLYHLAVEVLLQRWQKHKVGDDALAVFLKDDLKVRAVMESLAYAAHRASVESGGTGSLLRKDAIELLDEAENLGNLQLAGEFLDYVDQRAGLLVGSGGDLCKPTEYNFPHRTFQEYLAGAYLAGQRDRVRTFFDHAGQGDGWDLAAQLAFEELLYNRRAANEVLDLAYSLGAEYKPGEQTERALLWAGQIAALVGRETIERDSSPVGGKAYLDKLRPGLVKELGGSLANVERAEAGRALGKLGDMRPEIATLEGMQFCYVPAGKFIMGSQEREGSSDEQPQHEVELPVYWMGRYPVTNAQYAAFVQAGGYQNPDYWPEARKENVWKDDAIKGLFDDESRTSAVNFGQPFNLENHPMVGITWYEMLAYTRWLTETWQRTHILPEDWQVLLPSEAEWEKAARGGLQVPHKPVLRSAVQKEQSWHVDAYSLKMVINPDPRRKYPWMQEFTQGYANCDSAGIGSTSALGCFPKNSSPYGVVEMSGNVWEWTRTIGDDTKYKYLYRLDDGREDLHQEGVQRVLRGGAFSDDADFLRCAYRRRDDPGCWYYYFGFRVMVSPVFSK
jgi:formylglycine-generating enzyme required for sulfatase activity